MRRDARRPEKEFSASIDAIADLEPPGPPKVAPAGAFSLRSVRAICAKGTPKEIIDRLNAAAVQALVDPLVRSRLADLGEIFPREQQTPEALGAFHKAQIEKWWPLIKELGISAE